MNAAGHVNNRFLEFVVVNVNQTIRGELLSDTGGDADYSTIATHGSATTRARKTLWTYVNGAPSDLTPGWVQTTAAGGAAAARIGIEVQASGPAFPVVVGG